MSARRIVTARVVLAGAVIAGAASCVLAVVPAFAGTVTISGRVYLDADRSASFTSGDTPWGGKGVYLYDSAETTVVANTITAADGTYSFAVPAGTYHVRYDTGDWYDIRQTDAPTTTPSLTPDVTVTTSAAATVDFGWRPIVRSTDLNTPISDYVGPDGLHVQSYDDVVPAITIYNAVHASTVGVEAPAVTIRFDASSSSTTTTTVGNSNGQYVNYSAICYVTYLSWMDGDSTLSHEYGHAWTLYREYIVQQDPNFSAYLAARGLTGDSRLNSSYAWTPREMIAEDYRQLLGSATAAQAPQANTDIPPASQVPGLKDFLLGSFSGTTTTSPSPAPSPTATATASPSPTVTASPSPTATASAAPAPTTSPTATSSPSPTATASPSASPTSTKTHGGGGSPCKRC